MSLPEISIIIPTHNRFRSLERLLNSIERACKMCAFVVEVIVVDDGSSDKTGNTSSILGYAIVHRENQGPAASRNYGAQLASAPILLFIDDDCILSASSLEGLKECLPTAGRCVFSWVQPKQRINAGFIENYLNITGFPGKPWYGRSGNLLCMPTASFAIWKEDFLRVAGFCEAFRCPGGEDDLFTQKIREANIAISGCQDFVVFHDNRCSFNQFVRRSLNYGRGHELLCANYGGKRCDYELEFVGAWQFAIYIFPFIARKLQKRKLPGLRNNLLCIIQLFSIKLGALRQQNERESKKK